MAAELLTVSFSANERKTFERGGRYLEVFDAGGPLDLFLYGPQGEQQDLALGVLSGVFLDQRAPFARFDVRSPTAQTITLLLTDGRGGSRRQPGNVTVIDNSAARTLGGREFWGSNGFGAIAGNQSVVNIQNPAGSGVNVVVRSLFISSDVAGSVLISHATVGGTAIPAALGMQNKLIGGALSAARTGGGQAAPSGGVLTAGEAPACTNVQGIFVPANQITPFQLARPLVLQPGRVLLAHGLVANRQINAGFDVEELPS